jgi:hypothetical protein
VARGCRAKQNIRGRFLSSVHTNFQSSIFTANANAPFKKIIMAILKLSLSNIYLTTSFSQQLNPDLTPFQRRYVSYVKRCDELERKLRFFANEIDKFELDMVSAGNVDLFVSSPSLVSGTGDGSKKSGGQLSRASKSSLSNASQLRELNSYLRSSLLQREGRTPGSA